MFFGCPFHILEEVGLVFAMHLCAFFSCRAWHILLDMFVPCVTKAKRVKRHQRCSDAFTKIGVQYAAVHLESFTFDIKTQVTHTHNLVKVVFCTAHGKP